jgi:hypothetical protein
VTDEDKARMMAADIAALPLKVTIKEKQHDTNTNHKIR